MKPEKYNDIYKKRQFLKLDILDLCPPPRLGNNTLTLKQRVRVY